LNNLLWVFTVILSPEVWKTRKSDKRPPPQAAGHRKPEFVIPACPESFRRRIPNLPNAFGIAGMTATGEDNYETAYKFFDFEIGSKEGGGM